MTPSYGTQGKPYNASTGTDTVWLELQKNVPTLMSLLINLVRRPAESKPLLCLLASQIVKARHQRMGLVQRAVSVMLYGNGTAKQVFM